MPGRPSAPAPGSSRCPTHHGCGQRRIAERVRSDELSKVQSSFRSALSLQASDVWVHRAGVRCLRGELTGELVTLGIGTVRH